MWVSQVIFSGRISRSASGQLIALVALACGVAGLEAEGVSQTRVGKSSGDSILAGEGVEGGRRSLEELTLGVKEIGAVLQGPDLGKKDRQGIACTGGLLVGKSGLAGGLLHGQLGALLVAEEFE